MKITFISIAGLLAVCSSTIASQCHLEPVETPSQWVTMPVTCQKSMRRQIEMLVSASIHYLGMGAHFSRDVVNRPGFAKLFFDAANQEREHAIKLIDYMLMRGELTKDISEIIKIKPPQVQELANGVAALEVALRLESSVTDGIINAIKTCEEARDFNDYNLVDYLRGELLAGQYTGIRNLSDKVTTMKKMLNQNAALGEFIFDKKLLGMDI